MQFLKLEQNLKTVFPTINDIMEKDKAAGLREPSLTNVNIIVLEV